MGLMSKIKSKIAERSSTATGSGVSTGTTPTVSRSPLANRFGQAMANRSTSAPKQGIMGRMRSRALSKRGY